MGKLVVVGSHELRPHFDTCELFVGRLWNVYGTQALMIVNLYGTAPRIVLKEDPPYS